MRAFCSTRWRRCPRWHSFTLIELLVVIAIIAILVGLTLEATRGVFAQAGRKRATGEIQAIGTALEGYKTDNGTYPLTSALLTTTYVATDVSTANGPYQVSSEVIYLALAGQTNYTDNPVAGTKVYLPGLKRNQVGDAAAGSYIMDPFKNSYGYSTGTLPGAAVTNAPYSGSGFYDVWSTGGKTGTAAINTNSWIVNWQ